MNEKCAACGFEFRPDRSQARQWAALWDGALWRMYSHIDPIMRWGPYCTACIGPIANYLNSRKIRPNAMSNTLAKGIVQPSKTV